MLWERSLHEENNANVFAKSITNDNFMKLGLTLEKEATKTRTLKEYLVVAWKFKRETAIYEMKSEKSSQKLLLMNHWSLNFVSASICLSGSSFYVMSSETSSDGKEAKKLFPIYDLRYKCFPPCCVLFPVCHWPESWLLSVRNCEFIYEHNGFLSCQRHVVSEKMFS